MPYKDREQYNAYMREYLLKRYHARRGSAIVQLGGVCAVCGGVENLEIDHIDPKTKNIEISKMWSVSEGRYQRELALCQVLCNPHHLEKTLRERAAT